MREWISRVRGTFDLIEALEVGCFPNALLHWFAHDCADHAIRTANALGVTFDPCVRHALGTKRQWLVGDVGTRDLEAVERLLVQHTQHVSEQNTRAGMIRYLVCRSVLHAVSRYPSDIVLAPDWHNDLGALQRANGTALLVEHWQRRRLAYLLELWAELADDEVCSRWLHKEDVVQWEAPFGCLRSITLQQPHADLVRLLYKSIEGRTKPHPYRGPVLIHSASSVRPAYREHITLYQQEGTPSTTPWVTPPLPTPYAPDLGVVVATAQLIQVRPMTPMDLPRAFYPYHWSHQGLFAYVLADVQPLAQPVPMREQLGLCRVQWPLTVAIDDSNLHANHQGDTSCP